VAKLILWVPVVDGSVIRDNKQLQAARMVAATDWEMFSETVAHALFGWSETEAARRYAELIRAGNSPENIFTLVAALHEMNVVDQLPEVRCPTLVLHRPALPLLPPGYAERVAAAIPDARLALFEGSASAPFVGDWRAIDRAVAEFLDLEAPSSRRQSGRRALRLVKMKDDALTPREREIVSLVVRGLTNRQIAQDLFLAEKTVENHVGRILVKLDLRSRTELAAYAVEHGLTGTSS
jgi:DNA-binding CsgD family transcriptional regulator